MAEVSALFEFLEVLKDIKPYLSISKELRPDFENMALELAAEGGEWLKILAKGLDILLTSNSTSFDNLVKFRAKNLRKHYTALVKAGFKAEQAMQIILAERQSATKFIESVAKRIPTNRSSS